MPDKITLDDALTQPQGAGQITFDDAMSARAQTVQPLARGIGVSPGAPPGQEIKMPWEVGLNPAAGAQMMQAPLPATSANFGAAMKAAIPEDQQTKLRLLAGALFPNDPNGIRRVGLAEGRPVFVNDQGKLQLVSGPFSRMFANVAASTPETVGAVIGSLAEGQPITGAATGAAGGRALKRLASELMFGEPATPGSVGREMATEAALTAAGGLLGKGLAGAANRGRVVDFTPAQLKTAEQARTLIKQRTGIDLDLAQASGDRMLLGLRDYAAKYPGRTAEIIQARDEVAAGQLDTAVNRVLNLVSNAQPAEITGRNAINAAQGAIYVARQSVYDEVGPLYRAAYAAVPVVDRTTRQGERILDYLKLPYFPEAFSAGQKLRALETGSAAAPRTRSVETLTRRSDEGIERATTTIDSTQTGARRITSRLSTEATPRQTPDGTLTSRSETVHSDITQPSLAELDYTKRALDEKIESLMESGQRQRARALKIKRDEFVRALDSLPNQQWQLARQRYGELIEQRVTPLENSPVGVLSQMHPKNAQLAARIFNDPGITPEQIAVLKGGLSRANPDAYRGLVRQWLGQKYNMAMRETQSGDVINPAGKFRQAVIGTPSQKDIARAMLPADAADAFDDLMMAAEKLARTPLGASRIAGSPTASNQIITEKLKGMALNSLKWLITPRQALQSEAEQRALNEGIDALTAALVDPAKRGELRRIVKMKDSTRQLLLLAPILGGDVAASTANATGVIGEDVVPEAYRATP